MSRANNLFNKIVSNPAPNTVNRENYPAYTGELETQYVQTVNCNMMGNTFYADAKELMKEAEAVHDAMLKKDPEFAAKALIFGRKNAMMRLQPIFGLAKLAQYDTKLFRQTFPQVILTPKDLKDFLTIIQAMGRGHGGSAIKKAVRAYLNNMSEYHAIKYGGNASDKETMSLGGIIATAHPKPESVQNDYMFRYLCEGIAANAAEQKEEVQRKATVARSMSKNKTVDFVKKKFNRPVTLTELRKAGLNQIAAVEQFKRCNNADEQLALIKAAKLPHEVVTGSMSESDPRIWDALVKDMPLFATLKNLNTLERAGVLDSNKEIIAKRFSDPKAIHNSKVLPFRFLKAMDNVSNAWTKDVLRMAVENSINNLPDIKGRTAIMLDISASMSGDFIKTSSVFAVAMYKKSDAKFYVFDQVAEEVPLSKYDSVLTQASRIHTRGGTDTSAAIKLITQKHEIFDNIIMITDEQQNTGSRMYDALNVYRHNINKNVKMFVVDVSSYRELMMPEVKNNFYIFGWSDAVMEFIAKQSVGMDNMVEHIRKMSIEAPKPTRINYGSE